MKKDRLDLLIEITKETINKSKTKEVKNKLQEYLNYINNITNNIWK